MIQQGPKEPVSARKENEGEFAPRMDLRYDMILGR